MIFVVEWYEDFLWLDIGEVIKVVVKFWIVDWDCE